MNNELQHPTLPTWARSAAVLTVMVLLPSCSAWSWVKGRFSGSPPPAPTAAVSAPASVAPPPAPVAAAPIPPPAEPPVPLIAPPAPVTAEPLPAPAPPPAAVPEAPATRVTSTTPRAVPAPPSADMRAGRWGVQVGVFLVASNAETIRAKVAGELTGDASFNEAERMVRSVRKGERTHVVVGDAPDRGTAEQLAARLRGKLRQDVVLFQR